MSIFENKKIDAKLQAIIDMNKDTKAFKEKPNTETVEDDYMGYLMRDNDERMTKYSNDVSEWDDIEDGDWVLD
jgi:hypothetical protein